MNELQWTESPPSQEGWYVFKHPLYRTPTPIWVAYGRLEEGCQPNVLYAFPQRVADVTWGLWLGPLPEIPERQQLPEEQK